MRDLRTSEKKHTWIIHEETNTKVKIIGANYSGFVVVDEIPGAPLTFLLPFECVGDWSVVEDD